MLRVEPPHRVEGGGGRDAGSEAVVHEDHRAPGDLGEPVASVMVEPTLHLLTLLLNHGREVGVRQAEPRDAFLVEEDDAAGCDGAYPKLRLPRRADLAGDDDVERCV